VNVREQLCYSDAYARTIEARVDVVTDGEAGPVVVLDRTVFYPGGGGQPADRGTLLRASDGRTWTVRAARKAGGDIVHELDPADGGAPYEVQYIFPSTRMKAALSVGMELPVKVDPADPQRIAVQWDAQQASIAAAGGDMAAVTSGMQSAYGNVADQAMRDAQAKSAAEDPTAKLKKLTEMRDAGLITSEEFDAKKKELLADL
jgi:Ser-tRNA(Ala) deacylase AlaX